MLSHLIVNKDERRQDHVNEKLNKRYTDKKIGNDIHRMRSIKSRYLRPNDENTLNKRCNWPINNGYGETKIFEIHKNEINENVSSIFDFAKRIWNTDHHQHMEEMDAF